MNIAGVAVTMTLNKTHCVIVDHFDGSLGIVTEKDIIRDVVSRCRDAAAVRAWEIMKQPLITADEETDMRDAIEIMRRQKVRNLVVTHGEEIIGVVKRSTILNSIKFEEEDYWTVEREAVVQRTPFIH
ncbi:CBS domain-containing protein [Candidatus Woesearchaeota archaeon]|nr:CBS domain-containing protein [Candidatus Woesearchaeota archaeon]